MSFGLTIGLDFFDSPGIRSRNRLEAIPFTVEIRVEEEMEGAQLAAYGLYRDELKKQWELLDTLLVEKDGDLFMQAQSDAATFYAILQPQSGLGKTPPSHWSYRSQARVFTEGIITRDDDLLPDTLVKRERFVRYLVKSLGLPLIEDPIPFEDVDESMACFPYISTAYHHGLTQGKSPTVFGLGDVLSREQILTFLVRARGREPIAQAIPEEEQATWLSNFSDQADGITDWARPYIVEGVKMGLTQGYTDGTMRGKKELTHGEVLAFIDRLLMDLRSNVE